MSQIKFDSSLTCDAIADIREIVLRNQGSSCKTLELVAELEKIMLEIDKKTSKDFSLQNEELVMRPPVFATTVS